MKSRAAITSASALALAFLACASPEGTERRPPNILLIVSEDNGPELGAYGDPYARTPHLDALADQGVLFERAYVAQAGCSPSRAAFLTGLYPHQNGQIGLATWRFRMYDEATPNMASLLKEAGYRTGLIGKLHVNPEEAFLFDFRAIEGSNFNRKNLDGYAAEARRFIDAGEAPFFLSVNYPDAHRPFLRQADGLPVDPLEADEVRTLAYMGVDTPDTRAQTADYYNSMERLDALVGRLLQELDESGKAERTLVVYFGDHGADLLRGKRTSYEGGVRVPLIVRWPGHAEPGAVRRELVSLVDLLPTLLEAASAPVPEGLPGRSLIGLLQGELGDWHRYLFTEFHVHSNHNYYPQRTVRGERFKLIRNLMPDEVNPGADFTVDRFFGGDVFRAALAEAPERIRAAYERMRRPPEFELYDLEADPYEFDSLANDETYGAELERLREALEAWRRETEDPLLDPENVRRLKAEVDETFQDGQYVRPESWDYVKYFQDFFRD